MVLSDKAHRKRWNLEEVTMGPRSESPLSLSTEQQTALFLTATELWLFEGGLKGVAGFDRRSGTIVEFEVSPEVAKWAIPYAKSIREAEGLFKANRIAQALAKLEEIRSLIPNAAIVLMDIGVCYAEIGNKALAQQWLDEALQLAPSEFHKGLIRENLRRLQSRQLI
jgi:tetratricopeptide (TPR) repeat protein